MLTNIRSYTSTRHGVAHVINDSLNINEVAIFFATRERGLSRRVITKSFDATCSLVGCGFLAARRREELIEASFELGTKSHEANRLEDTCADGRIRRRVVVKLKRERKKMGTDGEGSI